MTTLETISTVIAAVAAILGGVWFILGKVFKMGVTAARIDNIEGSMTELKDSLKDFPCSSHHDDITRIKALLLEKYPKSASVFSCKCSPRRLNETGEKLFRAVDGEKFINENKTALFKLISDSRPLVELDVEQAAVAACLALAGTPAFNRIKQFIYEEPAWKLPDGAAYDITTEDVCFVIGLRLRDIYLNEVPGSKS